MTETAKVLHYPAKRGRAAVSAVERKIRKNKLLDELERLKIDVKSLKSRCFCGGRIVMYYNNGSAKPSIRINDVKYDGPVVFVAMDGAAVTDLTGNQMKAIRAVVKKI